MRRLTWSILSVVLMGTVLAWGASVHWKPGDPVLTDQGVTLLLTGSLAGLSNADLTVTLSASGTPTIMCTNRGGHEPGGQNPGDLTVVGTAIIPASSIQNGQVFVSVSTQPPGHPDPEEAGCPNRQFVATVTDIDFSSATVAVIQNGEVVLVETFDL